MKKYLFLFLCLFFCISIYSISSAEEKEDVSSTIDLVIAIDTSETMKGIKIEKVKNQVTQLCTICEKFNIRLSCITFSGIGKVKEIFKNVKIDEENKIFYLIEQIKNIKSNGKYTDQLSAIKYAENILANSNATFKYIIMLSDGMIDYVNRAGKAKKLTKEEQDAYDSFQDNCINFTQEDNQGIFLIGYENNVKMFSEIENKNNGLYYLYWKDDTSAFFDEIFKSLDYSVNIKKGKTLKTKKIQFKLKKGLFGAIVYIVRETNNKKSNTLTSKKISVKKGQEPSEIKCTTDSAIIYYNYPEKGEYILNLPKGIWSFDVLSLEDHRINSIDLKLFGKEKSEIPNKQTITEDSQKITLYTLDKIDSNLNLQINIEGNDSKNNYAEKKLYLKNFISLKEREERWDKQPKMTDTVSHVWSLEIKMPEIEKPIYYQVKVGNNKNYFYSNIIKIVYNEIIEAKEIYINEAIKLTELFTEFDENEILNTPLIVTEIAEKDEKIIEDKENEIYENENNKTLIFYKEGTYKITLKNKINKLLTATKKKENFCDKIKNILGDLFNWILNRFTRK